MAVNATAQAGVIGELEGAAMLDSSLDPQGSGPAFKVLKQLVANWLNDAVQNQNRCVFSNRNFWQSRLYDRIDFCHIAKYHKFWMLG